MTYETITLFGAVTTTSVDSAVANTDSLIDKWIVARGVSAGSATVLYSVDGGATWVTDPDITIDADGVFELPFPATHLKVAATGLTCAAMHLRARRG